MDDQSDDIGKGRPKMIKSQTSILSTISEKRDRVLWCFNDMRVYIVLDIITEFCFGIVASYYWPMATSIEKEFQLTSLKMGFLLNAWDIGRLPFLPLLSFFGGRSHIPRLLGFLQLLRALAIAMLVLPHFLFGQSVIALLKASAAESAITAEEQALAIGNYTYQTTVCHPPKHNATLDERDHRENLMSNSDIAYGMFIASYVLFGISFAGPGTIGMAYLDNNFDKNKMPLLIGIRNSIRFIAPVCGGALATGISTLYVDLSEPTITVYDPRWISAWWLGLAIFFIPPVILGPLICLFPRRMRKKGTINFDIPCITKRFAKQTHENDKEKEIPRKLKTQLSVVEKRAKEELKKEEAARLEEEFKKRAEEDYTIKKFPKILLNLLKNPVFMMLVLYHILQDFAWSGWAVNSMKYYEQIFRLSTTKVTMIQTVALVIIGPVGSVLGGLAIARLRPTFARTSLLMLFTLVIYAGTGLGRMFISCEDSTYAGLDYTGPQQLMGECNAGCECNLEAFSPVCDNGLTYFSPCHAGCDMGNITMVNGIIQPHLKEYFDCNCTHSRIARPGKCEGECDLIYVYVAVQSIGSLAWILTGSAITLMLIRSVGFTEKAVALGMNMFIGALLGSMPSGPLMGKIMDTTCTVWKYVSGKRGNCWIHNATDLRFRMWAWTLSFMTLQCIILLVIYFLAKGKNMKIFNEDDPMVLRKMNTELKVDETKENITSAGFNMGYSEDSDTEQNSKL